MLKAPRCLEYFAFTILYLAGLGAAAGPARAQPAEPGQVIGYAKADRSGPSQVWDLPPDKPYLYIPAIPATLNGRVMAIETGPEVGVALFKNPYFTSRDLGCQPTLGTEQAPRMSWLGATARFNPAPAGQAAAPLPEAAELGYGSLIVYRTDLGPPPGALFLSRRVTLGLRCANPTQKTVYNRIFVPVAEAPDAARCFDLVGNYPGSRKPFQLDFVKSDRLVLLMPGDMSERYAQIRHDYTATLYSGLSCKGASITLDSRARAGRDVRLTQLDFRDRARSLRLSYNYGNADAFLVRQEVPPPAPVTAAQEPKPDTGQSTQTLAAQPIEDPAVGQPRPVTAPIPAPAPEPPLPVSPAKAPAVQADPPPVRSAEALDKSTSAPLGEPVTDRAIAQSAQAPLAATPRAGTIPKLSPRLTPPGAQTAALPSLPKTFAFPVQDIYRLNHCLYWQKDCGEPAATAWCRAKGFSRALEWSVDENIGANFPTLILGNQEVCAKAGCDGFKKITCTP